MSFHAGMKLVKDEIIPAYDEMCLLFTRFCQDEKFHPGMTSSLSTWSTDENKKKRTCKHVIPGWNFTRIMFLLNFWRMYSKYFPTFTCLNIMKVRRKTFFYKKWSSENHYHLFSLEILQMSKISLYFYPYCKVSCIVTNAWN